MRVCAHCGESIQLIGSAHGARWEHVRSGKPQCRTTYATPAIENYDPLFQPNALLQKIIEDTKLGKLR